MDKRPEVIVHEHCGESGAIGAGVEALRLWKNGRQTIFIGLDAVRNIRYRTTRNENTRCYFCKNNCLRTFIDVDTSGAAPNPTLPIVNILQSEPLHASAGACGTHHREDPLKAQKQPLVLIQLSPSSTEFAKMPEPQFQDKKQKFRSV